MMKTVLVLFVCVVYVHCQTKNSNGNPTGEIGSVAFDEIVVESTLTVRGKPGSRSGKKLTNITPPPVKIENKGTTPPPVKIENKEKKNETIVEKVEGNVLTLKRSRRSPHFKIDKNRQRFPGQPTLYPTAPGGHVPGGRVPGLNPQISNSAASSQAASQAFNGGRFPSSASSQSSSQSFMNKTPFGSFGGSASQSASHSLNFGPKGVQASNSHSASQTFNLPNGSQVAVSFSNGFSVENGKPNFSKSHSVTLTKPNGEQQILMRKG